MVEPFSQVPGGQVGTGTAYVYDFKDRSKSLDAIAEVAKQKRVEEAKRKASFKGFNYTDITDPRMAREVRDKYNIGMKKFAQYVVEGKNPMDPSTPEGLEYLDFQNQIEDIAKQANFAHNQYEDNKNRWFADKANKYDDESWLAYDEAWNKAKSINDMIAINNDLDPTAIKNFNYSAWIDKAVDDVAKSVGIEDMTKDKTTFQQDYEDRLNGIPAELANTQEYNFAKVKWEKNKAKGVQGFQQATFEDFLKENVKAEGDRRLADRESRYKETEININNGNNNAAGGATVSAPERTDAPQSGLWLYKDATGKVPTRRADGKIEITAPGVNVSDPSVHGNIDQDQANATFTQEGDKVLIDPEQYAKNFKFQGGLTYSVGQDRKYQTVDVNLARYNSKAGGEPAKLDQVFYDQSGNMWATAKASPNRAYLLSPNIYQEGSILLTEPSALLNAKAVLSTFFNEKNVDQMTSDQVFRLIQSKFPIR